MVLEILPTRTAGAAENMAADFLLLQRYPRHHAPRFRHYGWRAPAFTFGYAQKIALVRPQLPAGEGFELCRRATGGGIVDHRDDWTYALVLPRGHPLEEVRASQSYRIIHEVLARVLQEQDIPAVTKLVAEEAVDGAAGVCFQRAELHDVIHAGTGAKIAGAAQKRNKHGLLFQGSLSRTAIGPVSALDWDQFEAALATGLAEGLGATGQAIPWPDFADDELEGLTEQYSSPEWNEHR